MCARGQVGGPLGGGEQSAHSLEEGRIIGGRYHGCPAQWAFGAVQVWASYGCTGQREGLITPPGSFFGLQVPLQAVPVEQVYKIGWSVGGIS